MNETEIGRDFSISVSNEETEDKEFFPLFRPSSSADGDTEKRYSERDRETEDAIGLHGWNTTGHRSL